MAIPTVYLTTGVPGTGKSYKRGAKECIRFLLEQTGVFYTNIALYPEKIADYCHKKSKKKYSKQHFLDRIHIIPQSELKKWEGPHPVIGNHQKPKDYNPQGPWSYFQRFYDNDPKFNLRNARIVIDECHNYCNEAGAITPKYVRKYWSQWIGELRHEGASAEFLTQAKMKLAKEIHSQAAIHVNLINPEHERDPFFKIELGDWYELKGIIFKEYERPVHEVHKRQTDSSKWEIIHEEHFTLDPFFFQFYDSYVAPVSRAGDKRDVKELRECEKRSRLGLLAWFLWRNWIHLLPRFFMVWLVIWLCFLGGNKVAFGYISDVFLGSKVKNNEKSTVKTETVLVAPRVDSNDIRFDPNSHYMRKRNKSAHRILLLASDYIICSDLQRYYVGDSLDGKIIRKINLAKSEVVFDDDSKLRFSR